MKEIITFLFSPQVVLYVAISFVPILGWLYFFQNKNREKKSYVLLTFIAGMLAVLPIKLYERYWNTAVFYFEHINVFKYLADLVNVPDIPKFLSYVTINALVGVGLFVFVTLMMFLLEIFTGDNTLGVFKKKLQRAFESPFFFISIGILCGIIAYIFSMTIHSKVWFFVIVGMLEEFVKHLVLRFSDEEKVRSVDDALSFAIIVALGFSFVENILYLRNFANIANSDIQQMSIFFFLRSTISVMAHICFSAILGYFYGVARFSNEIYQQEIQQNRHPIIRVMHKILHLKGSTLFHEEKMMEGMLLAMGAHAIFNSLLEFGKVALMVPFLLIMFWLVMNLFHKKKTGLQTGIFIST